MINITPVILCGGSGTRLWPLSRTGFPKQFLCLTGNESLFQQAALRLDNLGNTDIKVASPVIVTGEDHRFLASEQLREIGVELGCALLEPVGRNTAPALTLAALAALGQLPTGNPSLYAGRGQVQRNRSDSDHQQKGFHPDRAAAPRASL